jgi:hypothetical protein
MMRLIFNPTSRWGLFIWHEIKEATSVKAASRKDKIPTLAGPVF